MKTIEEQLNETFDRMSELARDNFITGNKCGIKAMLTGIHVFVAEEHRMPTYQEILEISEVAQKTVEDMYDAKNKTE